MSSLEHTVSTTKLKLKEKIAYGLGDVGNNFLFDLGQIYLLKFYTDILGLPAIWAGSIFLLPFCRPLWLCRRPPASVHGHRK